MGTDTSSPYHCPWKSEWRHWIGRKAGTTHATWVSVHISFRHIEWFGLKWTWQKVVQRGANTHILRHSLQLSVFGGFTLDYRGLTLMLLCLARQISYFKTQVPKTVFPLHTIAGWWNLPLHLFWKHVQKRMPCWYLNLILNMDYDVPRVYWYQSLPWTCDFALSIRSEIMFLFEKIAMCTEVEKILPQRHLSTSEDTTRTSVSHPSTC